LTQFSVESSHIKLKICSIWLESSWKYEQFDFKSSWIQNVNLKLNLMISLIIILNCISSFSYSDLTQILFKSDSDILFKSDSNVTQIYFNFNHLCIITLKCISFHLVSSYRHLAQIWLKCNSDLFQSFVHYYTKMRLHQLLSHFNLHLHLQFFLISFYFFSSFCRSSILKREVTVMMSNHHSILKHKLKLILINL